ncbi:MAG: aldehyde dehydrogenase family protein, partial [Candidatus Thermoplasmatota archaeon]|nr:aldehyde dehydrogenase family protein [Candidatus Thermoplasmatota archaeon]
MHERDEIYINGTWKKANGEGSIGILNPATEEPIGSVPVGNVEDVEAAIEAARSSFPDWSETTIEERADFLNQISEGIRAREEELAQLITAEVGTPIGYS